MEEIIGGSLLDDLREVAKCETLHDGDFVFKMVEELGVDFTDLTYFDMEPDHTFIARQVKTGFEYILLPDEISGFTWVSN